MPTIVLKLTRAPSDTGVEQATQSAGPLLRGTGKYLVQHVYERACQARADLVVVATDDQRIADAVLLMGSKDYARAIIILNEVIEKYPDHATAYPDALALLAGRDADHPQAARTPRGLRQWASS